MKNNLSYQSRLSGRNLKVELLEHVERLLFQEGEFLRCLPPANEGLIFHLLTEEG